MDFVPILWEKFLEARRKLAAGAFAVLALIIAYHAVFGANGALAYQNKKEQYRTLQKEVEQLQQENERITSEIKALKTDPKAIEKEAREQLRYAKPGEVVIVLPAQRPPDAPVDAKK